MKERTTPRPWQETLSDSVDALEAAAWEHRMAHRSAEIAAEVMDNRRLGVTRAPVLLFEPERPTALQSKRCPHRDAVRAIAAAQRDHRDRLRALFQEAALAYAYGAAWSLECLQAGEQPQQAEVSTDPLALRIEFPDGLSLGRCPEPVQAAFGDLLREAFDELLTCQVNADLAEDLAGRDKVEDWEAADMFKAARIGDRLPEAAYAYGVRAHQTLAYLLHFHGGVVSSGGAS